MFNRIITILLSMCLGANLFALYIVDKYGYNLVVADFLAV